VTKRWLPLAAIACLLVGLFMPVGFYEEDLVNWLQFPLAGTLCVVGIAGIAAGELGLKRLDRGRVWQFVGPLILVVSATGPAIVPSAELAMGWDAGGFWLTTIGVLLFAWDVMGHMSDMPRNRARDIAVPALFGLALVYLWQAVVVGFAIPRVLLPAPTEILAALAREALTLADDFSQTFLKAVIAGFVLGNALGFVTALAIDRVPFLQRGLLPLGNLVSAVPIVGVAPIMVMWFGFGWESKTAVIVIMIFFPMLINAIAGLNAAEAMHQDLMRSYGAGYWRTLWSLRLPAAMPFVFNALKINSTLALIGAIVSEFFGSPIAGMGFRISVEVARMNVDVVWATIAVAALAGSATYGMLAALERSFTFWHPSYRSQ
jgi:NitT/TauT family transport system permease protein